MSLNVLQTSTIQLADDPQRDGYRLTADIEFEHPLHEVFEFFSDAANLEQITPPSIRFRMLTPTPVEMSKGTLLDYRIRIHQVPVRWRTLIGCWEPPVRFVDEQVKGPYRWWIHEHTFKETTNGTHMRDVVQFGVPLRWLTSGWVCRDVREIFEFRLRKLGELFRTVGK